MKKFLSVALAIVLMVSCLLTAGCGKKDDKKEQQPETQIKVEDVKKEPAKFLSDSISLSLKDTPYAFMQSETAPTKLSASLATEGNGVSNDYSVFIDTEAMNIAVQMGNSQEFDGEEFTSATDIYFADNVLIVNGDLTSGLGVEGALSLPLDVTSDQVEASAIYGILTQIEGFELDSGIFDSLSNTQGLEKIVDMYIDGIASTVEKDLFKFETAEDKITVDGTEVSVIVITATLDEKIYKDLCDDTVSTIESLVELAEVDGVEDILADFSESLPDMSSTAKYYISAKDGALVKLTSDIVFKVSDYEGNPSENTLNFEITLGADPVAQLLPSFKITSKIGEFEDAESSVTGTTTVKDGKTVTSGKVSTVEISMAYDEDGNVESEEIENHEIDYTFSIDDKGAFELKYTEDEEEYSVTGTFTLDEKGFDLKADLTNAFPDFESEDDIFQIEPVTVYDSIELSVSFDGEMPEVPEHTSIFDLTAEDLAGLQAMVDMMNGGFGDMGDGSEDDLFPDFDISVDYETAFFDEICWNSEIDEDELETILAGYAEEGFEDEYSYLCSLYIESSVEALTTNWGATEEMLTEFMDELAAAGYSENEIAEALYDSYIDFMLPTTEEIREYLENYELYGMESVDEMIEFLQDMNGEYFFIPEELEELVEELRGNEDAE
ncbi:MAG: hypothetical protein IKL24_05345 [Clostridia bacterium]|nr:hypothetical protein [Clostridia bacterium]